jgi:hypothetical protein
MLNGKHAERQACKLPLMQILAREAHSLSLTMYQSAGKGSSGSSSATSAHFLWPRGFRRFLLDTSAAALGEAVGLCAGAAPLPAKGKQRCSAGGEQDAIPRQAVSIHEKADGTTRDRDVRRENI